MKTACPTLLIMLVVATSYAFGQARSQARHPAILLYEQRRFDEAIGALEIATRTKEFENDGAIWNYLGLSYLAKDEINKSRHAFEKSVSLDPKNAVFRSNLAYVYLLNRRIEKARKSAETAITLDPAVSTSYEVLTRVDLLQSKLDLAQRDV